MDDRPRLIAFEGVDGAGKSTVLELVAAQLRERGVAIHRPRVGKRHRSLPVRGIRDLTRDVRNLELGARAELALYCAREAQVLAQSVAPALAAGETVLLDRALLTPVVLGCWGRGLPLADCRAMAEAARGGAPRPDLTLVFDVDPRTARQRKRIAKIAGHGFRLGGRKGLAGSGLKARIRAGYRAVVDAADERDGPLMLIGCERGTPAEVAARVLEILDGAEPSTLDAEPWWRIPAELETEAALDTLPEDLAIFTSRKLASTRARRAAAVRRHPALVAWCLDRGDPLREQLAVEAWGEPAYALAGLRNLPLEAGDLRGRCIDTAPAAVARGLLGVAGEAADALRSRAVELASQFASDRAGARAIIGAVVESLAGREDPRALELRERLWPDADVHERAISLRSCAGVQARRLRAELFERDPARALASVRGLDPDQARPWLRDWAEHAPKSALRALIGRSDGEAHELREQLADTGAEVIESVAGLDDLRSHALREDAIERWPIAVADSLRGVPAGDATAALLARLTDLATTDLELRCQLELRSQLDLRSATPT